jgi:hypothetical protein
VQGDNTFGQVSSPTDLMKAQGFAHDRVSGLTHDFVNNTRDQEITGFEYALGAGNAFDVEISRPGRVYTKDGISYDLLADVTLDFAAANDDLPRYDLIVATIEDEVDAEIDLIPFVRLRTSDEFDEEVGPYAPQNISAPTELHWRAVPSIKTGTPAETPTIPAYASNEIPLYLVAVGAGVTQLNNSDVTDLRDIAWPIRRLNELVGINKLDIASLLRRVAALEDLAGQPIDLSWITGELSTLGDILADLISRSRASNDLPEIRYVRPKYALTDNRSSQILAVGNNDGPTPFVEIEIGGVINFGDAEVAIEPRNFADQSVNPRYATVEGAPPEHEQRIVNLTLDTVTPLGSHGSVDFLERAAMIDTRRSRPAAAARDDRYVEVFGGLSLDNSTSLGDWMTYDNQNDTLTPREPLSALPNAGRPAMFPYGDGTNVLLIAGDDADSTPQVFRINAVTGGVTEIVTTKPTGIQFFGDLIADNKMFIVAIRKVGAAYEADYWEYDTTSHTFTELGVTGSVPTPVLDAAGGCYYRENQFVMVTYVPGTSSSGRTFIFDRTTVQFTEINIPQAYRNTIEKQGPLTGFQMAHVNGRPMIVAGDLAKDTDDTLGKVWELTNLPSTQLAVRPFISLAWIASDASFPRLQDAGFCSTLGTSNLPDSKAFLFAGFGGTRKATNRIYASVQSGLIAASYGGLDGVSIGTSAKSVQFEIPAYEADWDVAAYLANLDGRFTSGNIMIEASFDDGGNWHSIKPGVTLAVTDSDDPAVRRLRITLYNTGTNPPILTRLIENLDTDGEELEDRTVIRYDRTIGPALALYIDRAGIVTLSEDIVPSTPQKAIIHKVTGNTPPIVQSYINRRRPHVIYRVEKEDAEVEPGFYNELAVPVRFVDARYRQASDDALIHLDPPTVEFNSSAHAEEAVLGIGDVWIVEVSG